MKRVFLMLTVFLLILSSCKKEILHGEGNISTNSRNLIIEPGFHTIKVNGSTKVFIKAGDTKSLVVKGYDNLLNAYFTEVKNGVLTLGYKENYQVRNDNVQVYITYPSMPNINLNGSCDAEFSGAFPFKQEITATINGSGHINYDSVRVGVVHFGSGKVEAIDMESLDADIKIAGSGEVRLSVEDELNVNISGSGKVYYKGNPEVEMNISGSGKIIPLN